MKRVLQPGFGYRRTDDGKVVEDPVQQEAIREIQRLRQEGYGWQRIARTLQERGFPPPASGFWYAATVRSIWHKERE